MLHSLHAESSCVPPSAARASRSAGRQHACRPARAARTRCAAALAVSLTADDATHILRAVELADSAAGRCAPHPKSGCVLVNARGATVAEAFQFGQGGTRPEVLAAAHAKGSAAGGTAYLNLEPVHGPYAGESASVDALRASGVARVVVGLLHPLAGLRGHAVAALQSAGLQVDVAAEVAAAPCPSTSVVVSACQRVNEALLHLVATGQPFSVWKYAMTLDGKIATRSGHSAWVSGPVARQRVYLERSRSDAVIVGGNTLRRDNPHLTTRQEGGHAPARVVVSRSMDLPESANLWNVLTAPTLVMTKVGTRPDVQAWLRKKGVEVIELPDVTPVEVMRYCRSRGFLQCFWECGGSLAAPAVSDGVVHKIQAFVAPKLIGGRDAPTPLGELGLLEMTQAVQLCDTTFELVGPDLLVCGYLPASGGLHAIAGAVTAAAARPLPACDEEVLFYKAWDEYGALSNFSPHAIRMSHDGVTQEWLTVESFYQAQKFAGVDTALAASTRDAVRAARTPEAAAKLGRTAQRTAPHTVRPDWERVKVDVMRTALRAKFTQHAAARALLLSTGRARLVENSPHDYVWGVGADGSGSNLLGVLLAELRAELAA